MGSQQKTHSRKRYRRGELIMEYLQDFFEYEGHLFAAALFDPKGLRRVGYRMDLYDEIEWQKELQSRKRSIERMKKKKLICEKKIGKKIIFELTNVGKQEALKASILNSTKKLPKGKQCLVSFDIPESQRQARDTLRWFLRDAQFQRVHQSVWASRNDVLQELSELVQRLDIADWVHIYLAELVSKKIYSSRS